MFGHLLPPDLKAGWARDRAECCAAQLREVVGQMPADSRRLTLHGLVRPDAILVGGYTATGHRCCPLTAAVWESTGKEVREWDTIMSGISMLGLTSELHHRFVAAFDEWAATGGHTEHDPDGLIVLTPHARAKLIDLVERDR